MIDLKWYDLLFNTQRWKEFQNHFHLLQISESKAQGKVLEQNRQIKVMETNLAILQNEMNEVRTAYGIASRELDRLSAQKQVKFTVEVKDPKAQAAGSVTSSEKTRRYQEQYRGGQIPSTPQDNTAILMQAQIQSEIYDDAQERAAGYPSGRKDSFTLDATPEQRAEIREENRGSTYTPTYTPEPTRHDPTPSSSDRSGGWGDSGGGDSGGGGGGGD
uniref:Uncharacterized protein n=1 Tax=Pseudomonas phage HRDY3 TaxID=3236930 RepID=A0AB39CDQ3_9VIRU